MKVVITDDDRVHVRRVSNYLKRPGLEPTSVYDGMQTMMFARRTNPELTLLDISMPGGNGFEILKNLTSTSHTGMIPVIVVSGSIELAAEGKVIEGGAVAFTCKPVEMDKRYEIICPTVGIPAEPPQKAGL
jgi:DNA-binding response OmpR family regulator